MNEISRRGVQLSLVLGSVAAVPAVTACMLLSPATTMSGPAAARGPSHPPTTDAQWTDAESRATRAAKAAGAEKLDAPVRMHDRGFLANHHVALGGGRCYHAGIAWAFDATLELSLSFDPGTNANLSGFSKRLDAPNGAVDFCADHAGGVTLGLTAIARSGALANDELLEYAIVVGSASEPAGARVARRAREADQAKHAREAAVASEKLMAQEKHDDASRKCHECFTEYSLCGGGDCRRAFDLCAHDGSYTDLAEHPETKPCGTP